MASISKNSMPFPLVRPTATATPAATAIPTATSKVQNIHIHLPGNGGDLESAGIHVHLNLNGSDTGIHKVQSPLTNENAIISGQSDDRPEVLNVKQVNGHQVNGHQVNGHQINGHQVNGHHVNGHPAPIPSLPSWSNGMINGSMLRVVPAATSASS